MSFSMHKVLEMAQAFGDIMHTEEAVNMLRATGTDADAFVDFFNEHQTEPGLSSADVLEALLDEAKNCYRQQLRTLSAQELRMLGTLIE